MKQTKVEPGDILTIEEAAAYLRIHTDTLRRMLKRREVPARKVAGKWLFSRRELWRWVENKITSGNKIICPRCSGECEIAFVDDQFEFPED